MVKGRPSLPSQPQPPQVGFRPAGIRDYPVQGADGDGSAWGVDGNNYSLVAAAAGSMATGLMGPVEAVLTLFRLCQSPFESVLHYFRSWTDFTALSNGSRYNRSACDR